MNAPETLSPLAFSDLKSQYAALRGSIAARMQKVLDHGQYIMGPEVQELEQQLAAFVGTRHCIGVASGTEALLIAMMAHGIGPGDEVITSPFTFAATGEMIVLLGATPVFVDVEADTCNLDASLVEAAITPRTRAIMPVSLYGQVADMAALNAIAARHGLPVIEDAAQSFGARYQGRRSCGLSTWGATSFFPSKPLGCYGDGGALFTDDDALAQAAREIRDARPERAPRYCIGVGGRLDTLQAAVLLAKLERFSGNCSAADLGARYGEQLAALPGLKTLAVRPDRDCVWGQYTVFVPRRAQVQSVLQSLGVPTAVHYPKPLHRQPAYATHAGRARCPVSEQVAEQVLSLPMSADLSFADQDRVVAALAQALG